MNLRSPNSLRFAPVGGGYASATAPPQIRAPTLQRFQLSDSSNSPNSMTLQRCIAILATLLMVLAFGCDRDGSPADDGTYIQSDDWPEDVERIVSLAPNTTELLFELGLGDRVVATTRYCDWPEQAQQLPNVGGMLDPDFEAILDAEPDVVVGTTDGADHRVQERFDGAGIDYGFVTMDDFASVRAGIRTFGEWFDRQSEARELINDFDRRLDDVRHQPIRQHRTALMVLDTDPYIAAGPGSLGDEMLTYAGFDNAVGDDAGDYPMLDAEQLLALNPQVVIITDLNTERTPAAIDNLGAEQVVHLDDPVVLRPGPRIPQAVELLAEQHDSP